VMCLNKLLDSIARGWGESRLDQGHRIASRSYYQASDVLDLVSRL
jgi:hypothetical protein